MSSNLTLRFGNVVVHPNKEWPWLGTLEWNQLFSNTASGFGSPPVKCSSCDGILTADSDNDDGTQIATVVSVAMETMNSMGHTSGTSSHGKNVEDKLSELVMAVDAKRRGKFICGKCKQKAKNSRPIPDHIIRTDSFGSYHSVPGLPELVVPCVVGGRVDVVVSWIENTNNFYVQLKDNTKLIEEMVSQMQTVVYSEAPSTTCFEKGMLVSAKFLKPEGDDQFYRAVVLDCTGLATVQVFYIDYGNTADVPLQHVHVMPDQFKNTPPQAICCSLSGVMPNPVNFSFFIEQCEGRAAQIRIENLLGEPGNALCVTLFQSCAGKEYNINLCFKSGCVDFPSPNFALTTQQPQQTLYKSQPSSTLLVQGPTSTLTMATTVDNLTSFSSSNFPVVNFSSCCAGFAGGSTSARNLKQWHVIWHPTGDTSVLDGTEVDLMKNQEIGNFLVGSYVKKRGNALSPQTSEIGGIIRNSYFNADVFVLPGYDWVLKDVSWDSLQPANQLYGDGKSFALYRNMWLGLICANVFWVTVRETESQKSCVLPCHNIMNLMRPNVGRHRDSSYVNSFYEGQLTEAPLNVLCGAEWLDGKVPECLSEKLAVICNCKEKGKDGSKNWKASRVQNMRRLRSYMCALGPQKATAASTSNGAKQSQEMVKLVIEKVELIKMNVDWQMWRSPQDSQWHLAKDFTTEKSATLGPKPSVSHGQKELADTEIIVVPNSFRYNEFRCSYEYVVKESDVFVAKDEWRDEFIKSRSTTASSTNHTGLLTSSSNFSSINEQHGASSSMEIDDGAAPPAVDMLQQKTTTAPKPGQRIAVEVLLKREKCDIVWEDGSTQIGLLCSELASQGIVSDMTMYHADARFYPGMYVEVCSSMAANQKQPLLSGSKSSYLKRIGVAPDGALKQFGVVRRSSAREKYTVVDWFKVELPRCADVEGQGPSCSSSTLSPSPNDTELRIVFQRTEEVSFYDLKVVRRLAFRPGELVAPFSRLSAKDCSSTKNVPFLGFVERTDADGNVVVSWFNTKGDKIVLANELLSEDGKVVSPLHLTRLSFSTSGVLQGAANCYFYGPGGPGAASVSNVSNVQTSDISTLAQKKGGAALAAAQVSELNGNNILDADDHDVAEYENDFLMDDDDSFFGSQGVSYGSIYSSFQMYGGGSGGGLYSEDEDHESDDNIKYVNYSKLPLLERKKRVAYAIRCLQPIVANLRLIFLSIHNCLPFAQRSRPIRLLISIVDMLNGFVFGTNLFKGALNVMRQRLNVDVWSEHKAADGRVYYHNAITKQSTWDKPTEVKTTTTSFVVEHSDLLEVGPDLKNPDWVEYKTAEGQPYYFNSALQTSVWEVPPELKNKNTAEEEVMPAVSYDNKFLGGKDKSEILAAEIKDKERELESFVQLEETSESSLSEDIKALEEKMRRDEEKAVVADAIKYWEKNGFTSPCDIAKEKQAKKSKAEIPVPVSWTTENEKQTAENLNQFSKVQTSAAPDYVLPDCMMIDTLASSPYYIQSSAASTASTVQQMYDNANAVLQAAVAEDQATFMSALPQEVYDAVIADNISTLASSAFAMNSNGSVLDEILIDDEQLSAAMMDGVDEDMAMQDCIDYLGDTASDKVQSLETQVLLLQAMADSMAQQAVSSGAVTSKQNSEDFNFKDTLPPSKEQLKQQMIDAEAAVASALDALSTAKPSMVIDTLAASGASTSVPTSSGYTFNKHTLSYGPKGPTFLQVPVDRLYDWISLMDFLDNAVKAATAKKKHETRKAAKTSAETSQKATAVDVDNLRDFPPLFAANHAVASAVYGEDIESGKSLAPPRKNSSGKKQHSSRRHNVDMDPAQQKVYTQCFEALKHIKSALVSVNLGIRSGSMSSKVIDMYDCYSSALTENSVAGTSSNADTDVNSKETTMSAVRNLMKMVDPVANAQLLKKIPCFIFHKYSEEELRNLVGKWNMLKWRRTIPNSASFSSTIVSSSSVVASSTVYNAVPVIVSDNVQHPVLESENGVTAACCSSSNAINEVQSPTSSSAAQLKPLKSPLETIAEATQLLQETAQGAKTFDIRQNSDTIQNKCNLLLLKLSAQELKIDEDEQLKNVGTSSAVDEEDEIEEEHSPDFACGGEHLSATLKEGGGEVKAIEVAPVKSTDSSSDIKETASSLKSPTKKHCSFAMLSAVPSDHKYSAKSFDASLVPKSFVKAMQKEIKLLQSALPPGIFVKGYENRMDLFSCMILGPLGTPYADSIFLFDIHLREDYPVRPPQVFYRSYSRRINPNLYEEGLVCLSLLGTWDGHETELWTSTSSLLQVFISIQSLILVAEPYYNEPGYERSRGTTEGNAKSREYTEMTVLRSLECLTKIAASPPSIFRVEILDHLVSAAPRIFNQLAKFKSAADDIGFPLLPVTQGFRLCVKRYAEGLRDALVKLNIPVPVEAEQLLVASTKEIEQLATEERIDNN